MKSTNALMAARAKYIRTSGIKDVDTLLSVYNENGVKAASQFNNQLVYTLEMSISLKDLGLTSNDGSKLSYQLSLKGLRGYQNMDNVDVTYSTGPGGRQIPTVHLGDNFDINHMRATSSPTDFWGDYTLAKKQ